jgi:hypothetical protein
MQGAKTVTLTFDEHGNPTVETDGYKGVGCTATQDMISKALGGKILEHHNTPEYNQVATKTNAIKR